MNIRPNQSLVTPKVMKQEIEHKFLVKKKFLPKLKFENLRKTLDGYYYGGCPEYRQGYLGRDPVVRVRIEGVVQAFLTIKGKGRRVRDEYEWLISRDDAKRLLKLCGKKQIRKTRHFLGPWQIDEFKGKHKGLWLAEIELPDVDAELPPLPPWIGKEVTNDSRYSNANLAGA